ncbi:phosphotransferase family protein [Streptomyces meridianus]|uniref:Aminoglycoside phosphotransferase family protein n=1 Tax=Streptomyces meridianus TaxID=2938945 RepID=A0ABT0XE66_9ACTN|nr:aminoglycoside phosphotransferase family protein [Streptomyces meridianus]MCM2580067.1 aminoglycoside phosphotransferase family protein [Streptomyces meridianus]
MTEHVNAGETDDEAPSRAATRSWVEKHLPPGDRIEAVERLRGGWTSEMRRLHVCGPNGSRQLVLRSFVKPFFLRHAQGLLTREAAVLTLLGDTEVPAAGLHAVDATGEFCDHPSLLMSHLPGTLHLDDADAGQRVGLLARQLVGIHRVQVGEVDRPRTYQAWTDPGSVRVPGATTRPDLWRRAVDVIRRDPPAHQPCFLHRDFHPGNVLLSGHGTGLRVSGVVDWVETSWGPADLDVAHCSTALALLHGVETGMLFAEQYAASGGRLDEDPAAHLYWRLLDALAFAPDAEKMAVPWRELGRSDLTSELLSHRLEDYIEALVVRYG